MADLASVFHWGPQQMDSMGLTELMQWRERARKRNEPPKQSPNRKRR